MSIFDIFKKKNKGPSSTAQFYADCVKDYHEIAKERGFIKKGIVLIPELIPIGNKTVIAYLQDPFFKTEYKNNKQMYYYAVMVFTLQTGMIFANKWHLNFSGLTPEYVDKVIKDGPADEGIPLLKQIGLTDNAKENIFYRAIFDKFFEKLKPYANNKDLGNYTFQAMLAAYQLGVSIMLSDYGY